MSDKLLVEALRRGPRADGISWSAADRIEELERQVEMLLTALNVIANLRGSDFDDAVDGVNAARNVACPALAVTAPKEPKA